MSTRFLRLIAYYVLMGWLSFEALAARQSFRDDSFGAFMLLCLVTLVPWFLLWAEPPRFSGLRGRASPLDFVAILGAMGLVLSALYGFLDRPISAAAEDMQLRRKLIGATGLVLVGAIASVRARQLGTPRAEIRE